MQLKSAGVISFNEQNFKKMGKDWKGPCSFTASSHIPTNIFSIILSISVTAENNGQLTINSNGSLSSSEEKGKQVYMTV
jgi:hypothetical protein